MDPSTTLVAPPRQEPGALLSPEAVLHQMQQVHQLMQTAMTPGEDYGVIVERQPRPGEKKPKPSLYKPGAQKLCTLFRLSPEYLVQVEKDGEHREYLVTCNLRHIPTGQIVGSGVGTCTTRESKYAWRQADRVCPRCRAETIKKSKDHGWYCWAKIGGCGAQFPYDDDPAIVGQEVGRKPNPDLPDMYNTCLKMAEKRALVEATLTATAASTIFTQDVEDLPAGFVQGVIVTTVAPEQPSPDPAPRAALGAGTASPRTTTSATGEVRPLWQVILDLAGGKQPDGKYPAAFFRIKDGLADITSRTGTPVDGKDRTALDVVQHSPIGGQVLQMALATLREGGKGYLQQAQDAEAFLDHIAGHVIGPDPAPAVMDADAIDVDAIGEASDDFF